MTRNMMALPCMLAIVLACGDTRNDDRNAGTAGSETGTLPADTGFTGGGIDDTAPPSVGGDTASRSDMSAPAGDTMATGDTAVGTDTGGASAPNQDQSGVTNTETGESELGGDVTQTSPDQGEPVTSKGDTVGTGGAAIADTAN